MDSLSVLQLVLTSSLLSGIVSGIIVTILNNRHARTRQLFDIRISCYSKLLARMTPMSHRWLTANEIQEIFPQLEEAMILSGKELYQPLNSLFIMLGVEKIERDSGLKTPDDSFDFKDVLHEQMRILMKRELGIKSNWRKYLKRNQKELSEIKISDTYPDQQTESKVGC